MAIIVGIFNDMGCFNYFLLQAMWSFLGLQGMLYIDVFVHMCVHNASRLRGSGGFPELVNIRIYIYALCS